VKLSVPGQQQVFRLYFAAWITFGLISEAGAQQSSNPSPSAVPGSDAEHAAEVDSRGDAAMGFSHALTTHHFLLFSDGGAIAIEADDSTDKRSITAIRQHVKRIAGMFARGDFSLPMFIHETQPPGVDTMKQLRSQITYLPENTVHGGQVRIFAATPVSVKAVHDFLRFQIKDHRTGDPITITESRGDGSTSPALRRPRPGDNLGHDAQPVKDRP